MRIWTSSNCIPTCNYTSVLKYIFYLTIYPRVSLFIHLITSTLLLTGTFWNGVVVEDVKIFYHTFSLLIDVNISHLHRCASYFVQTQVCRWFGCRFLVTGLYQCLQWHVCSYDIFLLISACRTHWQHSTGENCVNAYNIGKFVVQSVVHYNAKLSFSSFLNCSLAYARAKYKQPRNFFLERGRERERKRSWELREGYGFRVSECFTSEGYCRASNTLRRLQCTCS